MDDSDSSDELLDVIQRPSFKRDVESSIRDINGALDEITGPSSGNNSGWRPSVRNQISTRLGIQSALEDMGNISEEAAMGRFSEMSDIFDQQSIGQLQKELEGADGEYSHNSDRDAYDLDEHPTTGFDLEQNLEEQKEKTSMLELQLNKLQKDYDKLLAEKEAQMKHTQHEKTLLQDNLQQELEGERSKAKMLEQKLELESRQLALAQEQVEECKLQLLGSKKERAELMAQHQSKVQQQSGNYLSLEKKHHRTVEERAQETASLKQQLQDLQSQLDSVRSREQGMQALNEENQSLREELETMKRAQAKLLAEHKQELQAIKNANVNLVNNLANELSFRF